MLKRFSSQRTLKIVTSSHYKFGLFDKWTKQTPKDKQDQASKNDLKENSDIISSNPQELSEFKMSSNKNKTELKQDYFPEFSKVDSSFIISHSPFSLEQHLFSQFRWTPLIQKIDPSLRFQEEMYRLSKVRNWNKNNTKELIDAFLFEAVKETDWDYYYDYKCLPTKNCSFNGIADFLLYRKSGNHMPIAPVIIAERQFNHTYNKNVDNFNIPGLAAAAIWSLNSMTSADNNIQYSRVLQTNGHKWIMIEISRDGNLRKTGFYESDDPANLNKIYKDLEMQKVILGLIRYAAFMHKENEMGLKKAYDFIDEARYLTELDHEEKKKIEKNLKRWSFLPRPIRDFFFKDA